MKHFKWRWRILLAVWLAVIAIPALRYVAHSQLRNSIWPLTVLAGTGNERSSNVELLAQYPHDARVWMAAADEHYDASLEYSSEGDDAPKPSGEDKHWFPGKPEKEQHTEQRRRLDIAIEKFPNEAWLIAKRLKLSWGYMYGDRIGGELSDANLAANQAAGKPSPERQSQSNYGGQSYPNYTAQELQRVLALCKRGQQLEPHNAFYDWTESYFLALAWRDQEAWKALAAAAQKTQWNDHQLDEQRAQIAARELLIARPLLWEEKLSMLYAALFPQYARYREYARIVSWQAIKAQRRDDHAQALQLIGDFAKISAKMRDNSKNLIGRLVAVAMESIVVSNATYDARGGKLPAIWRRGKSLQQTQARFNSFGAYARAHGRRDLAQWVARDTPKAAAARAPITFNSVAGVSFQTACALRLLWIAGVLVLLTLPLCFAAWAISGLALGNRRVRNVLGCEMPLATASEAISKRDLILGALACGGFNLWGYGLLAMFSIAISISVVALGFGQFAALLANISDFATSWFTNLSSSTISGNASFWEGLFYTLFGYANENEQLGLFSTFGRWVLALVPLVFGALWCANVAVNRQRQWQLSSESPEAPPSAPGSLSAFFAAAVRGRLFDTPRVARAEEPSQPHFDLMALAAALLRALATGVFLVSWLSVTFWPEHGDSLLLIVPVAVAIATGLILWIDIFARWRSKAAPVKHRRRTVRFGVRLLRESWLGWLALGSLLFLLTLLLAAPLRFRANQAIDRYLRLGEIATLK